MHHLTLKPIQAVHSNNSLLPIIDFKLVTLLLSNNEILNISTIAIIIKLYSTLTSNFTLVCDMSTGAPRPSKLHYAL